MSTNNFSVKTLFFMSNIGLKRRRGPDCAKRLFTNAVLLLIFTLRNCSNLLSNINYKTPSPAHPYNVVFNLKSPLGDTKPNNF